MRQRNHSKQLKFEEKNDSYSSRILDGAAICMSYYILIVLEDLRYFLDGVQIKYYREDLLIMHCDSF